MVSPSSLDAAVKAIEKRSDSGVASNDAIVLALASGGMAEILEQGNKPSDRGKTWLAGVRATREDNIEHAVGAAITLAFVAVQYYEGNNDTTLSDAQEKVKVYGTTITLTEKHLSAFWMLANSPLFAILDIVDDRSPV